MEVSSILLNKLLAETARRGASSLHLSVGSVPMVRLSKKLICVDGENILTISTINKIIESCLDNKERERLEIDREIIIMKVFAGNFRFQVNIFFQKEMPVISFNYIPNKIMNLDDIGLPSQFKEAMNNESGLIVIAGSNDSGKTSTAVSLIEDININKKRYIITLEKPIEYMFVNKESIIEQRQIGSDVKSLSDGLKYCLNEDVDIVYVNKIDDDFESSIPLIIEIAEGNSLVILEMNVENSIRVIEKILNALILKISKVTASHNLADVLLAIASQKLMINRSGGLTLAAEIMIINEAVKSLIREDKIYQIESIIETSRQEGMISLNKSIKKLIEEGEIINNRLNSMEFDSIQ